MTDWAAVRYGPWCGDERELNLLGDPADLDILDLGCGDGDNSVALALGGARVTAWDIDRERTARADELARHHNVALTCITGDMHDSLRWPEARFDCILAVYVLPYSHDIRRLLALCRASLKPGGRLLAAMDHPLRSCFWDDESGEAAPYPVRAYYDNAPLHWRIDGRPVAYRHYTVAQWVAAFQASGLSLIGLFEPLPTDAQRREYWPEDSPLQPLGLIPHTLILIGARRKQDA